MTGQSLADLPCPPHCRWIGGYLGSVTTHQCAHIEIELLRAICTFPSDIPNLNHLPCGVYIHPIHH